MPPGPMGVPCRGSGAAVGPRPLFHGLEQRAVLSEPWPLLDRIWQAQAAGAAGPVVAVQAGRPALGQPARQLRPHARVTPPTAHRTDCLPRAAQLARQAVGTQRRREDQPHLIGGERVPLPAWPCLTRHSPTARPWALPGRPPVVTVVTLMPPAPAAIGQAPCLSCMRVTAAAARAFSWHGGPCGGASQAAPAP